jgi:molybdopterin synthase catalytic subunit
MDLTRLIAKIKKHPDFHQAGMILCHNGVVRSTSRNGRGVSGLTITVDHEKLRRVIEENKTKQGIIEILVEIAENRNLSVGDDVMFIVVAGDIRERVISVMSNTLDAIKRTVTKKTEFFT